MQQVGQRLPVEVARTRGERRVDVSVGVDPQDAQRPDGGPVTVDGADGETEERSTSSGRSSELPKLETCLDDVSLPVADVSLPVDPPVVSSQHHGGAPVLLHPLHRLRQPLVGPAHSTHPVGPSDRLIVRHIFKRQVPIILHCAAWAESDDRE